MKWTTRLLALLVLLLLLAAGWLWWSNFNDGVDISDDTPPAGDAAALAEQGAYLARIGNCLACHTARGGEPGAGGLPVRTPYGTIYTSNLTPDPDTGIGLWNANTFWRALHFGRSGDGRLLAPAFPYTHTTLLTRADSDALYSYFMSLPATQAETPPSELRWPYGTQWAQAIWRALYFTPGSYQPDDSQDATWNRGAYLVRGVAHCSVCHARRNALAGADWDNLQGGLLKAQRWYAPSLVDAQEGSVADWPDADIVRLLRTGVAEHGRASGPMAETVKDGTQYLSTPDAQAIAHYLRHLPAAAGSRTSAPADSITARATASGQQLQVGQRLYEDHCADCHGSDGRGHGDAYPALAGNRAVTMPVVDNLLQTVLYGGFNAATEGYPRPYGMPPFAPSLGDADLAAVLSYIRSAWGNQAAAVSTSDVHAMRGRSQLSDSP